MITFRIGIIAFLAVVSTVNAQTNYLSPGAWPKMTIKKVVVPKEKTQPFQLTFDLASMGKTPVAISEKQFKVVIAKLRWSFEGALSFTNTESRIVTVRPDKPKTVNALVSLAEGKGDKRHWIELSPGKYHAQLYVYGNKIREFDYHWLGQMPSDAFDFEVK